MGRLLGMRRVLETVAVIGRRTTLALAAALVLSLAAPGLAGAAGRCGDHPWCNTALSPDERAGLLLAALTRDEKISLLAGDELTGVPGREDAHTGTSNGVERVGLPPIYFSDGRSARARARRPACRRR